VTSTTDMRELEVNIAASPFQGMQLPPHFECDCIPYEGPSHCHRCSELEHQFVAFSTARCAQLVSSDSYKRVFHLGDHAALLAAADAFDQIVTVRADPAPELTTTPVNSQPRFDTHNIEQVISSTRWSAENNYTPHRATLTRLADTLDACLVEITRQSELIETLNRK